MPYNSVHCGDFCNVQDAGVVRLRPTGIYYGVMIWLRRAIAVPVGMLLLPALTALLMFQGVHSTLLSPDFHASELRRAGVYEFALDDLLTVALDEAREIETGPVTASIGGQDRELLKENPLIASGLSSEDIAASVRRVAPPDWLRGIAEQWIDQLGRYLTGERDDFDVAIGLDEQAMILIEEVKLLLRKADAGGLLFEALVEPEMERAAVAYVPFGLDVSAERLTESARRVADPDWVQDEVDAVLDEVAPYLVGDRDTFEIHVDLAGRAEVGLEEVKALLREADAYEVLYTNVVEPRVEEALGGAVALGFGIEVTDGEVTAALRRVAPPEWVQQQAERVLDGATFYLTGREESFAVAVSIEGNKREAAAVIEEAVGRRFDEALAALPKCTGTHVSQVLTSLELPACIPEGTPDAVVSAARSSVVGGVQLLLLTPIPDSVTFTDRHLRAAVEEVGAAEEAELIDSVREVLRDGWVYTQDDLRRDLAGLRGEGQGEAGVDPATLLDDVRMALRDGWTYNESDFREWVLDAGGVQALDGVDMARGLIEQGRGYLRFGWVLLALLLIAVGFLGGRDWAGRAAWGSGALLAAAGLVFLLFGPGYHLFGKSGTVLRAAQIESLEEARARTLTEIDRDVADFPRTASLVALKGFDVAESMADAFVSRVASTARNLAIAALVVMAAAVHRPDVRPLLRKLWPSRQ